jgi:hypothetical protein
MVSTPFTIYPWQWAHGNPLTHPWTPRKTQRWVPKWNSGRRREFPLTSQHCAHHKWHLHLSWCYHCWPNVYGFTFLILQNLRICCFRCSSYQKKELLQLTPHYQFLHLAIEVFGCFHKQVNVFLLDCVNNIWSFKRLEGLLIFSLVIFFHKKNQLHHKGCKHPSFLIRR